MNAPETRAQILARFSDEDKRTAGSEKSSGADSRWTLYDFVKGNVCCPRCLHASTRTFYHCGDDQCCWSHCGCECVWSPQTCDDDEDPVLADSLMFVESAQTPRRWQVALGKDGQPLLNTSVEVKT